MQFFKQAITYDHFKILLSKSGLEERLNEVRISISHEFLNQLNITLYQLWIEVSMKQLKVSAIFNTFIDSEGFGKIKLLIT